MEESKQIYSAKDFDFLLAQLKGEGGEMLSKSVDDAEEDKEEESVNMSTSNLNDTSQNVTDTATSN